MTSIASQEYVQRIPRARELRLTVPSQFESSPWRLVRWAALDWAIISLTWYVMTRFAIPAVTVIGIVIIASRLHALGALLHDACHSRVRSRAWPLVEALAGWSIASTIAAMRYHHLRHHRYSGTEIDPYRNSWIDRGPAWRTVLVLRGALLPLWWTLRALVAPIALLRTQFRRFYARAFLQDRSNADFENSAEVRACITADMRQLVAQIALLAGVLLTGFPVVKLYLLPWILAGVLNARRVMYEHAFAQITQSTREKVYAATIDHDAGPVLNALLYPRNLGLHRAHHLYPTASFVHLPRLNAAVCDARRL